MKITRNGPIPKGAKCQRCGAKEYLTKDHIIPQALLRILCVAKLYESENLQILCDACNKLKANALDPQNPQTMRLFRKYVDRYEQLYVRKKRRRQYIFRTLPVTSLTPHTTYLQAMTREQYLKSIYQKQIRKI